MSSWFNRACSTGTREGDSVSDGEVPEGK